MADHRSEALDNLADHQRRMDAMPEQRRTLILTARANGATWQQIADTLSMSVLGARKAAGEVGKRSRDS